jgi:hypothetical protein
LVTISRTCNITLRDKSFSSTLVRYKLCVQWPMWLFSVAPPHLVCQVRWKAVFRMTELVQLSVILLVISLLLHFTCTLFLLSGLHILKSFWLPSWWHFLLDDTSFLLNCKCLFYFIADYDIRFVVRDGSVNNNNNNKNIIIIIIIIIATQLRCLDHSLRTYLVSAFYNSLIILPRTDVLMSEEMNLTIYEMLLLVVWREGATLCHLPAVSKDKTQRRSV